MSAENASNSHSSISNESVVESESEIPVTAEYDVIIAGGGTAGMIAAISAARNGADTLIVEYHGFLGGNVTGGYMTKAQGPLDFGIRQELYERVQEAGGSADHYEPEHSDGWSPRWWSSTDVEQIKLEASKMVEECGADVLYYTFIADAIVDDSDVKGLVVENKGGRQAILADVVVDGTGDGDVAAKAGTPFTVGRGGDNELTQPMTLMFKMNDVDLVELAEYMQANKDNFEIVNVPEPEDGELTPEDLKFELYGEGFFEVVAKAREEDKVDIPRASMNLKTARGTREIFVNATRIVEGIGTDPWDVSNGVTEGYNQVEMYAEFLEEYMPGFDTAYVSGVSPFFGVRETRHIEGEYTLTMEDITEARDFEDSIGVGECIVDIHPAGEEAVEFRPVKGHGIPYRTLVPKEIDGLLTCGRCISVDHFGHGSTRLIPTAMLTGEGAGAAAALAVQQNVRPRDLDTDLLRSTLSDQGITLDIEDAKGATATPIWEI